MKTKRIIATFLAVTTLAVGLTGCGTGKATYADLTMMEGIELGTEEYGIAFRKGSDMVAKVDAVTAELFENGTMATIAETYGLTDSLVSAFTASKDLDTPNADSDYEYIKNKGKMIVGITDFDPMDYKDKDGKWIGFDAEYAEAVAKKLGLNVEFKEIVWENKEMELEAKSIDCVWNGMTITDAICNAADVTGAYIKNYQVVVVKDTAYASLESLAGKTIVAEAGSAGETAAKENASLSQNYKAVESQADALLEVKSGTADACVIDYTMAKSMLKK